MTRFFSACVLAAALLPVAACGLISSDITNFDLGLPNKAFTVDASHWGLMNADQLVSTSCASNPNLCSQGAMQACAMNTCSATCNSTTQTCDLSLFVSLYDEVDLLTEKPELADIQNQPILKVTIDNIKWEVTSNTLNVDTPEMVVYAAPSTVMTPNAQAKRIGTVPPVPAGMVHPATNLVFDADGKANLASFMGDYKTKFNILVGSELVVQQGDPVPQGAITVNVSVEAHAGV